MLCLLLLGQPTKALQLFSIAKREWRGELFWWTKVIIDCKLDPDQWWFCRATKRIPPAFANCYGEHFTSCYYYSATLHTSVISSTKTAKHQNDINFMLELVFGASQNNFSRSSDLGGLRIKQSRSWKYVIQNIP